jgi:hypothetical protein
MKRATFIFGLLCCAASLAAQEALTPEEEAKKKSINQIKLSEMAVYSDVVQMATDENEAVSLAQQKSLQMMQTHVVEVCAKRLHMDKKDVQEIWDVIDDKCQNIVVKKGDLFRVFTYIMKDALHLGPRKAKQEDIDEYLGPEARAEVAAEEAAKAEAKAAATQVAAPAETPVDPEMQAAMEEAVKAEEEDKTEIDASAYLASVPPTLTQTTQPATTTDPEAARAEAMAAVEAMNAQKAAEEAAAAQAAAAEAAAQAAAEAKAKAEAEAIAKAAEEARAAAEAAARAKANMPALCKTMLEKQNLANLMRFLNEEKNKQTLMYGSVNTMQYQDRCYIVILDRTSKEIVALLDKGTNERTNFVTGQKESLVNYKRGNYSAVLVQEY